MLFQIRGLTKCYGDRTVLEIPELDFEKGRIYSLLGPNGSGKTTLLEILSLLNIPTTGRIDYNGRTLDFHGNNLSGLRREIVMVQQNPVLFSTTVFKNLEFGLKIRGISKGVREKVIDESLDLVGMREFIHAEAPKLSGGETQRVAIARALACSPKVIFFDEPTANVDLENQNAIERIMMEINIQKDISVIFTTHNLPRASKLSREVISLFEGRLTPSLFENIFSGKIVTDTDGHKLCTIHGKVELLVDSEKSGQVRLSIDPLKIKIFTGQDVNAGNNILTGRLLQLTDEHDRARATIDVGIPLNLLLPKDQVRATGIYVGDEVRILLLKEAIRIL